jgi:predicted P-loop ATPase
MSAAPDKPPLRAVKSVPTLTILTNAHGALTKSYELIDDKLEKRTAAQMYEGQAQRIAVENLNTLADVLLGLESSQALTFGVSKKASATVVTKPKLKEHPEAIARTPEHLKFPKGPGVLFIDGDKEHFKEPIRTAQEFREALIAVEPALSDAPMLVIASASTFIYNAETGEQLVGAGGWHAYILVKSGADIPRAGAALYVRSWVKDCGSFAISKNGSLLDRSLIDQSVWQGNRIDFAAGAHCEKPLEQRRPAPLIVGDSSGLFDSSRIADLNIIEERAATAAKTDARVAQEVEAKRVRAKYIAAEAKIIAKRTRCPEEVAAEIVRRALEGDMLGSDFVLYPEEGEPVTVREILADPLQWHERRFADPVEPEYRSDRRIAYLNCAGPTGAYLYSHAHGGRTFELGDTDTEWRKLLRVEGANNTRLRDEENVRLTLNHDPALVGLVKFDEFAGTLMLAKPIAGTTEKGTLPRQWGDTDTTALVQYIQRSSLPKIASDKVERAVAQLAQDTGRFHPVREMLESLQWDGEPRIDTWLQMYAGANDAPDNYLRAVGAATLIGGVARIYRPGAKHDCALVLEGMQGAMKSTLANVLAMRDDWFSDSLPADLATKDARDHLRGKWVIELPELAQFRRSEIETVKAFMSRRTEKYRPAYGKHEIQYPRQCFFIGSTNSREYLVDPTGNRRFWPVKCGAVDMDALLRDREQLWAEAVHRYKAGSKWHLSPEISELAEAETATRIASDPWLPLVTRALPIPHPVEAIRLSPGEVLERMEIDKSQRHSSAAARVGQILIDLGWRREKRDRIRGWLFLCPPVRVFVDEKWLDPVLSPDGAQWIAPKNASGESEPRKAEKRAKSKRYRGVRA